MSLLTSRYFSDCAKPMAVPALNRTIRATATKEVIQVERRVQNLTHSAAMERRRVWRPVIVEATGLGAVLPTAVRRAAPAVMLAGALAGVLVVMTGLSGAR